MNVFRSATLPVVLLAFAMSTQGLLLVQGTFLLNREFIAEHLCENRDRPEMKCEGMCFLDRQMEMHAHHHDRHGEGAPDAGLPVLSGVAGVLLEPARVPLRPPPDAVALLLDGAQALPSGQPDDVFHPPRLA